MIGQTVVKYADPKDTNTRMWNDVLRIESMLQNVRGPYGGRFSINKQPNKSSSEILSLIRSTFAGATNDDVSLLFISTHGDSSSTDQWAGSLGTPVDMLKVSDLANTLKGIPGKIIIFISSCGSGASIYANGFGKDELKALTDDYKKKTEAFDRAVIKAFSAADPGLNTGLQANTGELRVENKFYVLTACEYRHDSYGWENPDDFDSSFNCFPVRVVEGIGQSGSMPADTDKNGKTTLRELYSYISNKEDIHEHYLRDPDNPEKVIGPFYQHIQVYPANSEFALFRR